MKRFLMAVLVLSAAQAAVASDVCGIVDNLYGTRTYADGKQIADRYTNQSFEFNTADPTVMNEDEQFCEEADLQSTLGRNSRSISCTFADSQGHLIKGLWTVFSDGKAMYIKDVSGYDYDRNVVLVMRGTFKRKRNCN